MTKAKKVVSECACPPSVGEYKPMLYLDLEGQDVSQVKGLAIGKSAEFVVTGKIVGLEQREHKDVQTEGKAKTTGSIRLEGYRVRVMGEDDNEFEKMAKEDED